MEHHVYRCMRVNYGKPICPKGIINIFLQELVANIPEKHYSAST